ncbi:hypothetical protein [Paraburkholderia heleia]|uniref:hypothetical protein n=1 Tax=Paraburkholderia heleia TaxID=634127 RepID=UPI002AB73AF1|nr:hypothetical protein [Paraburkholderia heleia]
MTSLKEEVKEIVEIVALVPDEHKAMCFEMLLKDALAKRHSPPKPVPHAPQPAPLPETKAAKSSLSADDADSDTSDQNPPSAGGQPKVNEGSDIVMADLHMKTRKFMSSNGLTLESINNVFYKEGDKFELLITDFGATNMTEGQIRIAQMQALHQALVDGEFTTTVEAVRGECKMRKCYDAPNFSRNFKVNAGVFDFGEWSKDVAELRLSEEGKKALAEVVKTLK